ncbi:integrin alpha-M-like [Sparus aurata]|uniref:integrin alpha-M-like n=1 Tax=Sparus aurata TaxID=8175 RepID=UPI0011C155DF|nr:integrin alpha-M-like [Sparus aurata]
MHGSRIFLPTYMVLTVAIRVSLAFNIDMTEPDVYTGERKDFFGYKVVQFTSDTEKGIIVTAPLQRNGSGGICKPDHVKNTQCFNPGEIHLDNTTIPVKHLGLSIAERADCSRFTVCSPSVAHECNENSYLNSVCYTVTSDLQQISSSTPAFQSCTKKTVDLVFLFDGSGSMTEADFEKNKDFIVDIMKSLNQTSVKFAAVQFSYDCSKVFDFNDYQAGRALEKLKKEPHMKSLTNTHRALRFVLDEIFENPAAGASPDATKVLVLITDGDPSDGDNGVIKRYDDKNIFRLVIGVKNTRLEKFNLDIASEPKDKNFFEIGNYNGLTGILKTFQNKIFRMEGSKQALAGELTNEMSQSGFSAVFSKDTLILGSVGTNTWRGSLLELHEHKETQIHYPDMKDNSYMGYSTSVGEKNKAPLYFTGAPRFEHKGRVVLFRNEGKNWLPAGRIDGEQIGSYFGAELCSLDIDSDGNTDFLLVGAPLFFQEKEKREGHIYVYTLTDKMLLNREQNISAPSMGRFGTTISSLADLNGDGLRDVAVGAPLEDDNRGAVYIFLGDKHRGIRSTFSQRILGKEIQPGLRFFGQSMYGKIDLGDDGLPDIVVGSQGMAVVFRSRPVFNVTAHLSFQPEMISTEKIDCVAKTNANLPMVNLTACFEMVETTKSKAGAISSGLNILYTLHVDPTRQIIRGSFNRNTEAKNVTSTVVLRDKDTCFNHSVYMPKCVIDTLSPISIRVNFAQNDSAGPILNLDSKRQAVVKVPFEKQCRKNDTCIAELELDFNFMTSTLLVAKGNYFSLSIKLSNHGDDSYNTSLSIQHPAGLSFSRMTVAEATRTTLHSCDHALEKTTCGISLPVYPSRSTATFNTSFLINTGYEWNDTVSVTITGKSDNTNSSRTNSVTKSIPVQFQIEMLVTVNNDTITYMNFSTEDARPKKMVAIYKIRNTGFKAFPINVSLFFPTKLDHNFQMENYQVLVQQNQTQCTGITDKTSEYCSPEKYCKRMVCDSFILDKESSTEFKLTGHVQFKDLKQRAANIAFLKRYTGEGAAVKFKSFIDISYDDQRYVLDSKKQQKSAEAGLWNNPTLKWTEVRVDFVIPPDELLIILTGVILGLQLLIIITVIMFKLGCFKRKTLEYYQEQAERASLQAASSMDLTPAVTEGTASQS